MDPASHRLRVVPALLILFLHGAAAVLVLWGLPRGFSADHLRFWSNTVIPGVLVLGCAAGLVAFRRPQVSAAILWGLAGLWALGGVSASLLFPRSLPLAWLGGVGGAVLLGGSARLAWRHPWLRSAGLALPGAVLGVTMVLAQRAPPPSTNPSGAELTPVESGWAGGTATWRNSDGRVSASLSDASVRLECGGLRLRLEPLLTFISRSPDRTWSNLAPASANEVRRKLTGLSWTLQNARAEYRDDGVSLLEITDKGDALGIEAFSLLRKAVYSHLNTSLGLEIEGRPGLALEFSAVPGKPVEILPSEYPGGLPTRAAYLSADGTLHVVEASSGEKGPFRTLQEGKLEEPLALTISDERGPACRIELLDWAAQASTALSPTAGWGLPQNAIEFHRTGSEATASAQVTVTLAGTSLGRGWDTVGHAPGIYRSRLEIRSLRGDEAPAHSH